MLVGLLIELVVWLRHLTQEQHMGLVMPFDSYWFVLGFAAALGATV